MSRKISILFILLVVLSSCTKHQSADAVPQVVLRGTAEALVSDGGFRFNWREGDVLDVLSDRGTVAFMLDGRTAGKIEGRFLGTPAECESICDVLAFPEHDVKSLSDTSLTVCLPSAYSYSAASAEEFDSAVIFPGWAGIEGGCFEIKHLCGYFVFNIGNIPADGCSFVFSATNNNRITGDFTADLRSSVPCFVSETAEKSDGTSVKISFKEAGRITERRFCIPVPVGEYAYEFEIYDTRGVSRCWLETKEPVSISRGQVHAMNCTCSQFGN